ncbi:MAG: hypothetical protein R3C12_08980 [Planctomycetaceae bacterium]
MTKPSRLHCKPPWPRGQSEILPSLRAIPVGTRQRQAARTKRPELVPRARAIQEPSPLDPAREQEIHRLRELSVHY